MDFGTVRDAPIRVSGRPFALSMVDDDDDGAHSTGTGWGDCAIRCFDLFAIVVCNFTLFGIELFVLTTVCTRGALGFLDFFRSMLHMNEKRFHVRLQGRLFL